MVTERPWTLSILLACTLFLSSSCIDVVSSARADAPVRSFTEPSLETLPEGLDLSPEAQRCEQSSCVMVRGLPGQRLENLCCATCQSRALALNLDNAQLVAKWKKNLSCSRVGCPSMGNCSEEEFPVGAKCQGGLCVLVWP